MEKEIREEVARYKPLCEEEENETDSDEFFCNILAKLESYITTRDELWEYLQKQRILCNKWKFTNYSF